MSQSAYFPCQCKCTDQKQRTKRFCRAELADKFERSTDQIQLRVNANVDDDGIPDEDMITIVGALIYVTIALNLGSSDTIRAGLGLPPAADGE